MDVGFNQDQNQEFEDQFMPNQAGEQTETATNQNKTSDNTRPFVETQDTQQAETLKKLKDSTDLEMLPGQQLLQNSTLKESTQKYNLQKEEQKQNVEPKTVTTVKVAQDSEEEDR